MQGIEGYPKCRLSGENRSVAILVAVSAVPRGEKANFGFMSENVPSGVSIESFRLGVCETEYHITEEVQIDYAWLLIQ